MKAAIIGAGLAGMSAAVELSEQGYEVELFESRPFVGGKAVGWTKTATISRWACMCFLAAITTCLP
jgi:uncharacterized protein with NAD-binding domain and iron-sulfur cluster